jgi:hypothetical protein
MYAGGSDGLACRRLACRRLACMGPDDGAIALMVVVVVVNGTRVIGDDAACAGEVR